MAKKKRKGREARDAEKRMAAFAEQQRRLARRRNVVGMLGLVPLIATFMCGTGTPLDLLCMVPREAWLLIWAALFGSFLGLTIRLFLERRRFARANSRPPAESPGP